MRALILAGGSGTRFWPASRRARPKQLLALDGDRSLLRRTVERLRPLVEPVDVWICTTIGLADAVRRELPEVPAEQILAEPCGRNTAPAIGWSVRSMSADSRDDVLAVLPADHRMEDEEDFRRVLADAERAVKELDCVMTLGVTPSRPETGYGYLELGEELDGVAGLRRVKRFTEKPDRERAEELVASGDYLWNAGIFVFRSRTLWRRLVEFEPAIADGLLAIEEDAARLAETYRTLPSISIDYAVMERSADLATLPLDCGWSDLGSWDALFEVTAKDDSGNALVGDAVCIGGSGNLLFADSGMVTVVGVSDLVVVRTADAVLVVPRDRAQEVKAIVDRLRESGREELL